MKHVVLVALLLCGLTACSTPDEPTPPASPTGSLVTFVELGSVNCVPCQMMQPIMKSLAERYGTRQLTVTFIDVIKDRVAAAPYHILMMPTQVFLDKDGIEFHRHEGFYPEASIDSLLQLRGLTVQ